MIITCSDQAKAKGSDRRIYIHVLMCSSCGERSYQSGCGTTDHPGLFSKEHWSWGLGRADQPNIPTADESHIWGSPCQVDVKTLGSVVRLLLYSQPAPSCTPCPDWPGYSDHLSAVGQARQTQSQLQLTRPLSDICVSSWVEMQCCGFVSQRVVTHRQLPFGQVS